MRIKFFAFILCFLLLFSSVGLSVSAESDILTATSQILDSRVREDGAGSVQQWLDTKAAASAGNGIEWYVMALSHSSGYDFSKYAAALSQKMYDGKIKGAVAQQRCALTLISCGYTNSEVSRIAAENTGKQGIMSYIYGLHLINNFNPSSPSKENIIEFILSAMIGDDAAGFGWAISGSVPDVDVTAMAVQALAPFYETNGAVKQSVDRALAFLSSVQLENGDFKSMGIANPESGAQVLVALSGLGIDYRNDSRFIKNGNTVIDGIMRYNLSNGKFSHIYGQSENQNSAMQVFYAFVAQQLSAKGSDFYTFLKAELIDITPETVTPPAGEQNSSSQIPTTSQGGINSSDNDTSSAPYTESMPSDTEQETTSSVNSSLESCENETAERQEKTKDNQSELPWQLWLAVGVLCVAAVVIAVLYITKRSTLKNNISVLIVAFVLILVSLFIQIESNDQYYSKIGVSQPQGTVTVEIVCTEIAEFTEYPDGIILPEKTVEFSKGDTAFDVLERVVRENKLLMEKSGSASSVYILGIEGIYEFDYGELSGWVYLVNGKSPNIGCSGFEVTDGDKIVWAYTIGKEIS